VYPHRKDENYEHIVKSANEGILPKIFKITKILNIVVLADLEIIREAFNKTVLGSRMTGSEPEFKIMVKNRNVEILAENSNFGQ